MQIGSLNDAVIAPIADQTYTGSQIRPAVTVTLDGRTVGASQYTVSYDNNVNAGTATVTVTGTAGTSGTKSATFNITPITLADANVTLGATTATYTGSAITVPVTVKVDGKTLNPVSLADPTVGDYVVVFDNNINAGTATVTVTGKNNYAGTVNKQFTINPADISGATVQIPECAELESGMYTERGQAWEPVPTVTLDGTQLVIGTDVSVTYQNNINAGTSAAPAKVIVAGTGNYTGTAEATFNIVKHSGTVGTPPAGATNRVIWYVDSQGTLTVTPKEEGTATLGDASDPAWTQEGVASSITNAVFTEGVVGCTSMKGLFKGCANLESFDLSKLDTASVLNTSEMFSGCAAIDEFDLSGLDLRNVTNTADMFSGCAPSAFVLGATTLAQNADASAVPAPTASNNRWWQASGNAWLTPEQIAALGANAAGRYVSVGDMAAVTVTLDPTAYDYDGNAKTPEVTVKLGDDQLAAGVDYDVRYLDNTLPGTARAQVVGKGLYQGTKEAAFTINGAVPVPAVTSLDGTDWAPVYDPIYYAAKNPDVAQWAMRPDGTVDGNKLLSHFVNNGTKEGRASKEDFDIVSYYNAHPDLRRAFGTDWTSYYRHYAKSGQREGRRCTGVEQIVSPATKLDNMEWAPVYDPLYYLGKNADLNAAFTKKIGGRQVLDDNALLRHFVNSGAKEGRLSKESFELASYYNANPDLRRAFGNDWASYYRHYASNGAREGRACTGVEQLRAPMSTLDGLDWSPVYDGLFYAASNADVARAFTLTTPARTISVLDDAALLRHFVNSGAKEGRLSKESFELASYYNANPDLRRAFGNDWARYYRHYASSGAREGRACADVEQLRGATTTRDGVDWSAVYDGSFYAQASPDVARWATRSFASGSVVDDVALLQHFVNSGRKEGRAGKETFELASYYNANPDLRRAFGTDWARYYDHYRVSGQREGRAAAGVGQLRGAVTTAENVNWAPVYDANHYAQKNTDVARWARRSFASGSVLDDAALLSHFVNSGTKEARASKQTFDVRAYKSKNADLARAFGSDWKSYYRHYALYGINERRPCV